MIGLVPDQVMLLKHQQPAGTEPMLQGVVAAGFNVWEFGTKSSPRLLRRGVPSVTQRVRKAKSSVNVARFLTCGLAVKALASGNGPILSASVHRWEMTGEDHWSELLKRSEQPDKVGVWASYPLSTDPNVPVTLKEGQSHKNRGIRSFERNQDGTVVTQTNVYDQDPKTGFPGGLDNRADGNVQRTWAIEKEKAIRSDGLVHPILPPTTNARLIFSDGPITGTSLGLWLALRLPSEGAASAGGRFSGELYFGEEGGNVSIVFVYPKTAEKECYSLGRMAVIQEANAKAELVAGDVDFDALEYRARSDQLPRDPAEWMSGKGWTGRRVTLEIEGDRIWRSEGEAVWKPPDASDNSRALVFTESEGYFCGPRTIVPVDHGNDMFFEVGKRSSETVFQRVVWKYDGRGECVEIDHEVYTKNGN